MIVDGLDVCVEGRAAEGLAKDYFHICSTSLGNYPFDTLDVISNKLIFLSYFCLSFSFPVNIINPTLDIDLGQIWKCELRM